MPPPPTSTEGQRANQQGVAAPAARWSGAGFLAGAGAVGILWGTVGRTPPPQPTPTPITQPAPVADQITAAPPTATTQPRTAEPLPLVPSQTQPQLIAAQTQTQPQATPTPAPAQQTTQPATQPASAVLTRINVNTAGPAELDTLPRIGPALAQRIIDFRAANGPFRSLQDLERVSGIGPKTVERLAPHVTFD